jgi:peptidyl-prolyl cis-trans isomerase SurA
MIRGRAMPRGLRVAMGLLAFLSVAARAEIANRIVATIDGEPITAHEVRQYATEHGAGNASDEQVLDALITDKLLEKEIKAQGITARDEEIDRYVDEIRARNGMDPEHFEKALATQGMTLEKYRAKVKAEIEKAQLVNREIRQRVNISPEEIQRYYDSHGDDYALEERVKVRDIFFAVDRDADDATVARTRDKAVEVRELAVQGRDFGALAAQFSEGPGADRGGELGTFARGEMDRDLEQAAFALDAGHVSDPVRTASGFHIVRVDQRIAAGHKPLEDVKDQIRETLYNDALEERFQNWLSRDLRERHHVEVLN